MLGVCSLELRESRSPLEFCLESLISRRLLTELLINTIYTLTIHNLLTISSVEVSDFTNRFNTDVNAKVLTTVVNALSFISCLTLYSHLLLPQTGGS